jgi:hypothetical protein
MTTKHLSRRDFLKIAGLTLAVTTVTCSGLGYAATRTPDVETPELVFEKDNTMNNRILITYATRAGSTPEIAAAIAESMSQRGFAVDVKSVKERPSIQGYQAVLMGSAIRMGSWLPEAVDFYQGQPAGAQCRARCPVHRSHAQYRRQRYQPHRASGLPGLCPSPVEQGRGSLLRRENGLFTSVFPRPLHRQHGQGRRV